MLVFFDDILIYSRNVETHRDHSQLVLSLMREHKLFINRKKCSFERPQLEYLGHLISGEGVAADSRKVADMDWLVPKDLTGVRGFLGLTGYYRRFVMGYGKTAWALTQQLKKDNFNWGVEVQMAFEQLKKAMTSLSVLAVPCFDKEFIIEADASGKGIGAVLMQEGHLVAYMRQVLLERVRGSLCTRERVDGNSFGNPKVEALPIRKALCGQHESKEPQTSLGPANDG